MRILLACGKDGLLEYRSHWRALPCPLPAPSHLAARPGGLAAADSTARLLWTGSACLPIDAGLEALALWQGHALTLSGDTDSLTLTDLSSGQPVLLTPAGNYPQDFCFLDANTLAVCGGADGLVHVLRVSDLRSLARFSLPGITQRVACTGHCLAVLCLTGDDSLRCLLCRIPLPAGPVHHVCTMDGLPGALCPDGRGGLWAAATERLLHFPCRASAPDLCVPNLGLIRHLVRMGDGVLLTDPLSGVCAAVAPDGCTRVLYEGDVRDVIVAE